MLPVVRLADMTNELMNTCDPAVGGASADGTQSIQVFPKPLSRLPSIVVETLDGGEVESGELRWPPADVSAQVTGGGGATGQLMGGAKATDRRTDDVSRGLSKDCGM